MYIFYKVRQRFSVENKSKLTALNFMYGGSDKRNTENRRNKYCFSNMWWGSIEKDTAQTLFCAK